MLPAAVIQAAIGGGRDVFVLGFEGETDPALIADYDHAWGKRLTGEGPVPSSLHFSRVLGLTPRISAASFVESRLRFTF